MVIIAGVIGSCVSVPFLAAGTKIMRGFMVFSGSACAVYLTPLVVDFFELPEKYQPSIGFIIGLFGMQFVHKIHETIKDLQVDYFLEKAHLKLNNPRKIDDAFQHKRKDDMKGEVKNE
jgi:paired small multidrug resistance pump